MSLFHQMLRIAYLMKVETVKDMVVGYLTLVDMVALLICRLLTPMEAMAVYRAVVVEVIMEFMVAILQGEVVLQGSLATLQLPDGNLMVTEDVQVTLAAETRSPEACPASFDEASCLNQKTRSKGFDKNIANLDAFVQETKPSGELQYETCHVHDTKITKLFLCFWS